MNTNLNLAGGILGLGYSVTDIEAESGILNPRNGQKLKITTKRTNYGVSYLYVTPQFNYFGGFTRASYYQEQRNTLDDGWWWNSTGTNVHSDSATIETNQFSVGMLYKANQEIAVAALLSPAYGGKEKIENTRGNKTIAVTNGSGNEITLGIGYNKRAFSAGFDFLYSEENKSYAEPATNTFSMDAYYLLQPNFSLASSFSKTQAKKLTSEENVNFPSYDSQSVHLGFNYGTKGVAFGIQFVESYQLYDAKESSDPVAMSESGLVLNAKAQF